MDELVVKAMNLLEREASLLEIVRLVGAEALSPADRLALEVSKSIREDYLHQNAFHKIDTFTSIDKQFEILKAILHFQEQGLAAVESGVDTKDIFALDVREQITRSSYVEETDIAKIVAIRDTIDEQMKLLSPVA